jgi:bifunctional enzyme CysN/CysC
VTERAAGATIWLTGIPGAGKSTVGGLVCERLIASGRLAWLVDGDDLRRGLSSDLGFSEADRAENVRRAAHVALSFARAGGVAVVSLVSPFEAGRLMARRAHDEAAVAFVEVHLATPYEVCEARDPKGLYARARRGELTGLTGFDAPYEPPRAPELTIGADGATAAADASRVLEALSAHAPGHR